MGGCCCSARKPQLRGTTAYYYVSILLNVVHDPLLPGICSASYAELFHIFSSHVSVAIIHMEYRVFEYFILYSKLVVLYALVYVSIDG